MAAAAGTSDRMLIYHFGNKDGLIGALLRYLAAEMAAGLDAILPPLRAKSEADLIADIVSAMRSEPFKPYVRVWLDIVSAAAHRSEAHRGAGHAIIEAYLDWIALRHPSGRAGAAMVLAIVEGIMLMDAVDQHAAGDKVLMQLKQS